MYIHVLLLCTTPPAFYTKLSDLCVTLLSVCPVFTLSAASPALLYPPRPCRSLGYSLASFSPAFSSSTLTAVCISLRVPSDDRPPPILCTTCLYLIRCLYRPLGTLSLICRSPYIIYITSTTLRFYSAFYSSLLSLSYSPFCLPRYSPSVYSLKLPLLLYYILLTLVWIDFGLVCIKFCKRV